jgi:rhombotail lipoprotein
VIKNLFRGTIVLIIGFLAFGCASKGFNRGALQEQVGVVKPAYDDKQIKDAYNKKPNLPKPFKVGVYFMPPKENYGQPRWRWTEQDKAFFEDVGAELKTEGLVSEVFPIAGSLVTADDLKSLRLVAAKHQADALLIVGGAAQIDRYTNNWGWTYILLVPALFVPGSEADTLFLANASMWDVKNEFLYLTAEAEATTSETYVAAFGNKDKELVDEAKAQALAKLKIELKKMIKGNKR